MVPTAIWPGEKPDAEGGDRGLAQKLLIALWKYLDTGELPAGAEVNLKKIVRVKTAY